MLTENPDGTCSGGPYDALIILHDVSTGTYHAAFIQGDMDTNVVRLRSKMSHTTGAPDFAGAQAHLDDLVTKVKVPPKNIGRERPVKWDGTFIKYVDMWKGNVLEVLT